MARLNCTSLNPLSSVFLMRVSHRQMLARCGSRKEAAEISQPIDIVSDQLTHLMGMRLQLCLTAPPSPHKLLPCPTIPPAPIQRKSTHPSSYTLTITMLISIQLMASEYLIHSCVFWLTFRALHSVVNVCVCVCVCE